MSIKAAIRPGNAYDDDFYAWTKDQAEKLRARQHNQIDWDNLAEEIESVGRSDRRAIRSNLHVILLHLLKWQHQPEKRKSGWVSSISEHRNRLRRIVEDSPSLRDFPADALPLEYEAARIAASREARLPAASLPEQCPYTIDEVLDPEFPSDLYDDWPE